MSKAIQFRCECPVTSALDVLGDKWNLVIIKQMILEGKRTFKDFSEGAEGIATNILSTRLKLLEGQGLIEKNPQANNKKSFLYTLTEKGLDLLPVILHLALWSDKHLRDVHPDLMNDIRMEMIKGDATKVIQQLRAKYLSTIALTFP